MENEICKDSRWHSDMLLVHISADGLRKTRSRDSGHGQHVYGQRHGNRLRRRDGDQDYPYGRQRRKRFGRSYDFGEAVVTISEEGTYILSGTLTTGMVIVDAGDEDKLRIVLDDASITSQTSAALYVRNADKVFVTTATRLAQQSRICRRICGHR